MKLLYQLVDWLCASQKKTKSTELPIPKKVEPALVQAAPIPKPEPFTDDSSPPGYKIRWHC